MKKFTVSALILFVILYAAPGCAPETSVLGLSVLGAAENDNPAIKNITGHYASRNFIAGAVSQADLTTILSAGIRAPSAGNRQPWHFTVVRDQNLGKQLVPDIVDGNILIVISASGDGKTNGSAILDCALAAESIYLAAQALGLGSRIYTGPMDNLNRSLKGTLGLPSGYSAVALVRIGRIPSPADAVSAASSRKSADSMINYK
jgi:nitroreductase